MQILYNVKTDLLYLRLDEQKQPVINKRLSEDIVLDIGEDDRIVGIEIESCLVVGFAGNLPIHAVCGWRGEKVALITVYIPRPPKFVDPWTRGGKANEESAV